PLRRSFSTLDSSDSLIAGGEGGKCDRKSIETHIVSSQALNMPFVLTKHFSDQWRSVSSVSSAVRVLPTRLRRLSSVI
ncbi:MAG TPA: hypothetical protein VGK36_17770, partial [Candidatus Angelobacter sp.]